MECTRIRELLSEYIDGILDVQMKAHVEEHLLTCKDCKKELVSLKALVNELSSLESVEAPKDFLDKLHERMEPSFTFGRLMRMLFVPVRTKIPLEAATAAAIVILIFAGLYTHQPEKQIAMAPEGSTQIKVAKKATMDRMESTLKKEAYKPKPAFEEATAVLPGREREPIELVLLLETEASSSVYARRTGMKATAIPEKGGKVIEEEKTDMISPSTTKTALQAVPDAEMKVGELSEEERAVGLPKGEKSTVTGEVDSSFAYLKETFSKVKNLIGLAEGRVVSMEYDKQTKRPRTITAEIPSKNCRSFYEELGRLAPFRTPPPAISEKDQKVIQVRIRFISSN